MVTTIKITCDGVFIQSNPYNTSNDNQNIAQSMVQQPPAYRHDGTSNPSSPPDLQQSIQNALTVVIRNNFRKSRGYFENDQPLGVGEDVGDGGKFIYRPSYHYMYLVRKVPASRSVTVNATQSTRDDLDVEQEMDIQSPVLLAVGQ